MSDAKPTHSDVDGKKVVFIGWTETQTNSIFGRADEAPATVTEVTFGAADKTVYAPGAMTKTTMAWPMRWKRTLSSTILTEAAERLQRK